MEGDRRQAGKLCLRLLKLPLGYRRKCRLYAHYYGIYTTQSHKEL